MIDPTISDTAVGGAEIVTDDTDEKLEDNETKKEKKYWNTAIILPRGRVKTPELLACRMTC